MLVAIYPLVFVIIGLLLYAFANEKTKPIGLWVFIAAFHVLMMTLARTTFRIG